MDRLHLAHLAPNALDSIGNKNQDNQIMSYDGILAREWFAIDLLHREQSGPFIFSRLEAANKQAGGSLNGRITSRLLLV